MPTGIPALNIFPDPDVNTSSSPFIFKLSLSKYCSFPCFPPVPDRIDCIPFGSIDTGILLLRSDNNIWWNCCEIIFVTN